MTNLAIHWKNKESKNYVDLIPTILFDTEVGDKEIEHDTRKPNGSTFVVRSTIRVKGNTATLTYRLSNNDPKSIWPGVTRILFETTERKVVHSIEWQDEGDVTFVVPDPPPVWLEDNKQTEDQRVFVIKTDSVELRACSGTIAANGGLRSDSVVPVAVEFVAKDVDGVHLVIGDFDACRIGVGINFGSHL